MSTDPRFGPVCPMCGGTKHLSAAKCLRCSRGPRVPHIVLTDAQRRELEASADALAKSVGYNTREYRLAAGLSGVQLSERAGIATSTVYSIESGHNFRISEIAKIAQALGIPAWKLLEPRWRTQLRMNRKAGSFIA